MYNSISTSSDSRLRSELKHGGILTATDVLTPQGTFEMSLPILSYLSSNITILKLRQIRYFIYSYNKNQVQNPEFATSLTANTLLPNEHTLLFALKTGERDDNKDD